VYVRCFRTSTPHGRISQLDLRLILTLTQSMIYPPVTEWVHHHLRCRKCQNFPTRRYFTSFMPCRKISSRMPPLTNCKFHGNATNGRTRRNWRYHKGIQLWLTKPQDATVTRTNESFEQGEFIFWDVNMWQKVKQKFFLSYDMLEIRDTSLPYEEANPDAVKLERRSSVESRKVSGKQIGSGSGAE
jgi:hypothetical protein